MDRDKVVEEYPNGISIRAWGIDTRYEMLYRKVDGKMFIRAFDSKWGNPFTELPSWFKI